ncbi:MAG: indole-3-glycerol phosphate synthase TrpC [Actinomycetota bacterium]
MSYLEPLIASTRRRIEDARRGIEDLARRSASAPAARGFARALGGGGIAIVAEIKRASPRKGPLDLDLNAASTAAAYARGGAAALSVLTEPDHFKGTLDDLVAARGAGLPVLRKDFILDAVQLLEARAAGADAVLLIVRILEEALVDLHAETLALGMDALVEVHDEVELQRSVDIGAQLIGVNHRDLTTFEVDPERTAKLAPLVPEGTILIALSGVSTRAEVEELEAQGADAVLVGESLVTSADPEAKLRELLGAT